MGKWCYCCHNFLKFFLKHWNIIPKLWWSLPVVHFSSSWVENPLCIQELHLQQRYGFVQDGDSVYEMLASYILHIHSVLLLWIQRTLACKAVLKERIPVPANCRSEPGAVTLVMYTIYTNSCVIFRIMFCDLIAFILQNRIKQTQKSSKGDTNLTFVYCCE